MCLNNLAILAHQRGSLDHAIELARQLLDAFHEVGDRHGAAAMYHNLAGFWFEHGSHAAAKTCYEQASALFTEVGDVRRTGVNRYHLVGLRPEAPELSSRELAVAEQVASGLTNREIAAQLFISERTAWRSPPLAWQSTGRRNADELPSGEYWWTIDEDSNDTPSTASAMPSRLVSSAARRTDPRPSTVGPTRSSPPVADRLAS